MASPALSLSDIVDVVVQVSPQLPNSPTFNIGLIVGPSTVIPSVGANSRVRQYTGLSGMLTDGFTTASPEYIAASLYFGVTPAPQFLDVGRQNLTALIGAAVDAAGSGYAVGDTGTVAGGTSGKLAIYQVTTISGGGSTGPVTGIKLTSGGDGYTAAVGVATTATTGGGTGLTLTTTGDVGETPLIAVQACRAANTSWYACMVTDAVDADHIAIAAYAQSAAPSMIYMLTTGEAAVLNNTANNLLATLQAANYNRVFSMYSTTLTGAAPNNVYAVAAAMGVAMGLNTGLANSFFTLMFKVLTGVFSETGLTQNQMATLSGNPGGAQGLNANLYVGYANSYTFDQRGQMANGQYFDEIINLDMLTSAMQFNVMNLLVSQPSVPQTDPGQTQIIHAVNMACQSAVDRGFIAPGTWQGVTILNLSTGDNLPAGYLAQSPAYATQSPANRQARQAMPVYVAIIEAGAVEFVLIGVTVQR